MFHGPLIKIKKVFHKDIRFFRPLSPFLPFWKRPEVGKKKGHQILDCMGKSGRELEGKYANISLPDWMRVAASSRSFFIRLKFCRATWPLQAGETDTASVCVCVCAWVCVIADLPLWNKTGSYIVHKIPLQNLAEAGGGGMDPFELSVLLLLLPSVALHPRGSNCGYRTLYSYEHNTLQVTQGTFMTNLHLFHKSVIKGCVDILMLICIFFFFKSGDPCCVPDWMMTAPRLLFSLSLR